MDLAPFDFSPRTRLVFGVGACARLGELARELEFRRTLLAADAGLRAAGHVEQAASSLRQAGVEARRQLADRRDQLGGSERLEPPVERVSDLPPRLIRRRDDRYALE